MFDVSEQSRDLHVRMSADLEKIDDACKRVMHFLEKLGLERYDFDLQLLTREALINAVVHGCGSDSRKKIEYFLRLEGKSLIMEVEDEGEGFDWSACLGKEPEATSEGGRGLLIMKNYSTQMAYNSKGNRLFLKKTIG